MAPNTILGAETPNISEVETPPPVVSQDGQYSGKLANEIGTDPNYKPKIYKPSVVLFSVLHLGSLVGFYFCITGQAQWKTIVFGYALALISGESITMGAHRYYSHRSFKASFALRFLILLANLLSGQNSMYTWVRDHRLHHKFSDTDADPHNAKRGFFFSHIGWLMCKKHPAVKEKLKTLDLSDIHADKLVMFQYNYFRPLYIVFSVMIPVYIPVRFFGESFITSLFVCYFLRYVFTLNSTWTVNSLAHMFGNKPYDKNIMPRENWLVSVITLGEGWHNYHHAFPWDYKTSEYGIKPNLTTMVIHFFAYFGMAYDLRTTSDDMIERRIVRTGDGTHQH